jgi:hypothetical protein
MQRAYLHSCGDSPSAGGIAPVAYRSRGGSIAFSIVLATPSQGNRSSRAAHGCELTDPGPAVSIFFATVPSKTANGTLTFTAIVVQLQPAWSTWSISAGIACPIAACLGEITGRRSTQETNHERNRGGSIAFPVPPQGNFAQSRLHGLSRLLCEELSRTR